MEIKLAENSNLVVKDHNGNALCSIDEATGNVTGGGTKLYVHTIVLSSGTYKIVKSKSEPAGNLMDVLVYFNASLPIYAPAGQTSEDISSPFGGEKFLLKQTGPNIDTANELVVIYYYTGSETLLQTTVATNVSFVSDTVTAL